MIKFRKESILPNWLMKIGWLVSLKEDAKCRLKGNVRERNPCRKNKNRCFQYGWSLIWHRANRKIQCSRVRVQRYSGQPQIRKLNHMVLLYLHNIHKVKILKANQLPLLAIVIIYLIKGSKAVFQQQPHLKIEILHQLVNEEMKVMKKQ